MESCYLSLLNTRSMKGVVFTEFLEMVEDQMGLEMVDNIIDDSNVPNEGAYTAVGYYPTGELTSMVDALSKRTGLGVPALLEHFGNHFFGSLVRMYPIFFTGDHGLIDFLGSIHDYIHVEVKKLYPDSKPPSLIVEYRDEHRIDLLYHSPRAMGALARGLLKGAAEHFDRSMELVEDWRKEDGTEIMFSVRVNE